MTKTVPFSRSYSLVGIKEAQAITLICRCRQNCNNKSAKVLKEIWLKKMSNKAQDNYENHVK